MAIKTAAVIFGGASSEYEVSLMSAASVLRHIPAEDYDVIRIGITKDGRWLSYSGPVEKIEDGSWAHDAENCVPAAISPDRAVRGAVIQPQPGTVMKVPIDVAFPVLHGKNGEDGTIQGLFELAGIPYVGCPVLASAVCMDKAVSNMLLDHSGIRRAPWRLVRDYERAAFEETIPELEEQFGYPMFVKPANAGSSVGITKAADRAALRGAVDLAFEHDGKVIIEKNISGQELEVSVLGNTEPIASLVGEILPSNEFYDYEAKYLSGTSQTLIPARITPQQQAEIQRAAVAAFLLLDCRGMARVDFLLESATGFIYLNELNTIPGFTSISMYAKMLEASGVPYGETVRRLLELALERAS